MFLDGPHDTLLKIHVFNSTIRILRILDRDLTLDTQQIGHFAFATEFPKVIFHHIFLIPGHLFLYILKIFGKLGVGHLPLHIDFARRRRLIGRRTEQLAFAAGLGHTIQGRALRNRRDITFHVCRVLLFPINGYNYWKPRRSIQCHNIKHQIHTGSDRRTVACITVHSTNVDCVIYVKHTAVRCINRQCYTFFTCRLRMFSVRDTSDTGSIDIIMLDNIIRFSLFLCRFSGNRVNRKKIRTEFRNILVYVFSYDIARFTTSFQSGHRSILPS